MLPMKRSIGTTSLILSGQCFCDLCCSFISIGVTHALPLEEEKTANWVAARILRFGLGTWGGPPGANIAQSGIPHPQ